MRPPNRLRQRRTNIHNLQLLTRLHLALHRHRIRHHNSAQLALIQCLDSVSGQNAVCDDGYDFARAVVHHCFGSFDKRAAGVSHVVDEDGDFVFDVADEDHAGDFVGAGALFVDECEAEVEAVGDRGCSTL
jgi:hypothetical protein